MTCPAVGVLYSGLPAHLLWGWHAKEVRTAAEKYICVLIICIHSFLYLKGRRYMTELIEVINKII